MTNAAERNLPLTIQAIDPAWLTEALSSAAPGVVVRGFTIEDEIHGLGTVLRLRLDLAANPTGFPTTVIIKGGFEPHSRGMARSYIHEALSYRDVWPEVGLNVAKTFYIGADAEQQQAIIIMEDLKLRNVRFGDLRVPHTPEEVARSLTALAKVHARTWNSPEFAPGGRWADRMHANGSAMMTGHLTRSGYFDEPTWRRFCSMPRGAATSVRFHDLDWARAGMASLAARFDREPKCIVHGDPHLSNMFEDPDGSFGFYDTMARIEVPYLELAYHVTLCLDPADRRSADRELVRHYLAELRRYGAEPPTFEDAMEGFALYQLYGFMVFFINEAHYQAEANSTACCARISAAMLDHGSKEKLAALS